VTNGAIDFTETSPPDDYHMNYVTNIPCEDDGALQAIYDVRWHVDIVGEAESMPTNTYLVTVGARRLGSTDNTLVDSLPVNLRVMVGN
jgi:hypothetical protein